MSAPESKTELELGGVQTGSSKSNNNLLEPLLPVQPSGQALNSAALSPREKNQKTFNICLWVGMFGYVLNTALHTSYGLAHMGTRLCGLAPTFLKVSPYALGLSLIPVAYLSWAEAWAHKTQAEKLHSESEILGLQYFKLSYWRRFCQLKKSQQWCLIGHIGSYLFQDIQSGILYSQRAGGDDLDRGKLAAMYLGFMLYAFVANFQEFPNTLVGFEERNDPSIVYFSYGGQSGRETGKSGCPWHRVGFLVSNFLNTLIYASYALAHFFTLIFGLEADFYGVSLWAALMSILPILFFSYSEARAHDAQTKELECSNSNEVSSGIFPRLKALSWEQIACVSGHYLSDIFQDVQPLVFIALLAGMKNLSTLDLVLTYLLMVLYGVITNGMEALNTISGFEGENAYIAANALAFAGGSQEGSGGTGGSALAVTSSQAKVEPDRFTGAFA